MRLFGGRTQSTWHAVQTFLIANPTKTAGIVTPRGIFQVALVPKKPLGPDLKKALEESWVRDETLSPRQNAAGECVSDHPDRFECTLHTEGNFVPVDKKPETK